MIMDRGDHPRSRGEYARPRRTPIGSLGSSPLSRGIHSVSSGLLPVLGIIPALAGNTRAAGVQSPLPGDHPRSRGEYAHFQYASSRSSGSSPLSRGILLVVVHGVVHERIIPALAGNTTSMSTGTYSTTDHPRSRGEYENSLLPVQHYPGSSPLSRGIRGHGDPGYGPGGIIPALAGNTRAWRKPIFIAPDHPRSRGEYSDPRSRILRPLGSSPLSRGILESALNAWLLPRIIPALAGNTS